MFVNPFVAEKLQKKPGLDEGTSFPGSTGTEREGYCCSKTTLLDEGGPTVFDCDAEHEGIMLDASQYSQHKLPIDQERLLPSLPPLVLCEGSVHVGGSY